MEWHHPSPRLSKSRAIRWPVMSRATEATTQHPLERSRRDPVKLPTMRAITHNHTAWLSVTHMRSVRLPPMHYCTYSYLPLSCALPPTCCLQWHESLCHPNRSDTRIACRCDSHLDTLLICSSPGNFTSQGLDQISNFFCLQQKMMGLSYSSLYQSNLRTLQFSVFYNYSTTQEVPLEHPGYGFVKFSFSMVPLN